MRLFFSTTLLFFLLSGDGGSRGLAFMFSPSTRISNSNSHSHHYHYHKKHLSNGGPVVSSFVSLYSTNDNHNDNNNNNLNNNDLDERDRFIAELQDLNEAFESVQESIRANSKLYEMKLSEYELETSQVRSQLAKKEALLMTYQTQLEEQQEEYDKERNTLKQKWESTKQELEKTQQQLDDLSVNARRDNAKLQANVTSTMEELTLSQAERQRLQKQAVQWTTEREQLLQTQAALKVALQDIQLKLTRVSDKAKEDAQQQQQMLMETKETMRKQYTVKEQTFQETISSLEKERDEWYQKNQKLQLDLKMVSSTSGDKDTLIQQLKQKLQRTKEEVTLAQESLTKTLEQKEMEEAVWKEETNALIQEKTKLMEQLNALESSLQEMQKKYTTVEQELNFVRDALAKAQEENRQNEKMWKEEKEQLQQVQLDLETELQGLKEKSEQDLKRMTMKYNTEKEAWAQDKQKLVSNLERSELDLVQLSTKTDEERQALQKKIAELEQLLKETTERELQLKKDFTELKAKANTGMLMDQMRVQNETKMIAALNGKIVELEEERKSLRKLSSLGLKRVGSLLKFWKSDHLTGETSSTNTEKDNGVKPSKSTEKATVGKRSNLFKKDVAAKDSFLSKEEKQAAKQDVEATRRKTNTVARGVVTSGADKEPVVLDFTKKDTTK
jgi:chromosome segregation ATPase